MDNVPAGQSGRWKFVHRKNKDEAVCLISKIAPNAKNGSCKAILKCKSSNSEGIRKHFQAVHDINIDEAICLEEKERQNCMNKYLTERKFNDIWSFNSVISKLVCVDLMTLNQVYSSISINKLLEKEFKMKITSLRHIKKIILDHCNEVKIILRKQIENAKAIGKSFTVSFDEWSAPNHSQMMNIIVHFENQDINLGLITIEKNSTAENLLEAIRSKIISFGLVMEDIKVIIADGASVNSKISYISGLPIQKCINHCVQLAIIDTFYNRVEFEEKIEESSHNDEQLDIDMSVDDEVENNSLELDDESVYGDQIIKIEVSKIDDEQTMEIEDGKVDYDKIIEIEDEKVNDDQIVRNKYDIKPELPQSKQIATELNKEMLPIVSRVRKMVKMFRYPKASRILKKYTNLKLILDCKTRWTSLEKMIGRFLDVKDAIKKACIDMKMPFDFSNLQIITLENLREILQTATNIITILSSERANLNTSDLAISSAVVNLNQRSLISKIFASNLQRRFIDRRTELSDILAFFLASK